MPLLDVPAEPLRYLTRLLAAERRRRGTPACSRALTCRDQALMALRWFRSGVLLASGGTETGLAEVALS